MGDLDSIFDKVPDGPDGNHKSDLASIADRVPDVNAKTAAPAAAATAVSTPDSLIAHSTQDFGAPTGNTIPSDNKKFPDVMPGGQATGTQGQDVIKPDVQFDPESRAGVFDYSSANDKSVDNTAKSPLEDASAFSGAMGKGLTPLFHGLDYMQTQLGDQLKNTLFGKGVAMAIDAAKSKGVPDIGLTHPFKLLYDAMVTAANGPQMPKNGLGDIATGVADAIPQVLAAWVAPEITAAPLLEKMGLKVLAEAGLGGASKFGLVTGTQAMIESVDQNQGASDMKKITAPAIQFAEKYITGVVYDLGGAVVSKTAKLASEAAFPEYKAATINGLTQAQRMDNPYAHPEISLTGDQVVNKMLVHGLASYRHRLIFIFLV